MHVGQLKLKLNDYHEVLSIKATYLLLRLNDELETLVSLVQLQATNQDLAQARYCLQDLLDRLFAKEVQVFTRFHKLIGSVQFYLAVFNAKLCDDLLSCCFLCIFSFLLLFLIRCCRHFLLAILSLLD